MSLTLGSGPFGANGGTFNFAPPSHVLYWEAWPRRMRAVFGGATVLDSRRGRLLHETGQMPRHYFPRDDLVQELLVPATGDTPAGQTPRWSVRVGDRLAENCVSGSPTGPDGAEILPGHVTLEFPAMDRWFEEDEPIYAHPRDPYHRVDVRAASRRVVVRHQGRVVATSERPKLLFETGLPIRYYLPFADIRIDLLTKSATISECPYKGDGQHWHLRGDDGKTAVEDVAWSLPHPLPEGLAALEHVCFYPDKIELEVDGQRVTT